MVFGAPLLDHAVFVLGWETIAMTMSTSTTNDVPLLLEAAFLPLFLFSFTSTTTLCSSISRPLTLTTENEPHHQDGRNMGTDSGLPALVNAGCSTAATALPCYQIANAQTACSS